MRRHKQSGFSLVELLIVVAIIMVISAIAIPNMLRARINANETSAIGSLRTINTAETYVHHIVSPYRLLPDLPSLGGSNCATSPVSTAACIIDKHAGDCHVGFHAQDRLLFHVRAYNANLGYTVLGDPAYWNHSGTRRFYTDSTGVIRFNATNQTSLATDPAIQ